MAFLIDFSFAMMSQAHDGATLPAGEPSHVADRSCHAAEHNDDATKILEG